jgi:hypothetical protein
VHAAAILYHASALTRSRSMRQVEGLGALLETELMTAHGKNMASIIWPVIWV